MGHRGRDRRSARALVALLALALGGCFWPAPGTGGGRQAFNALETRITVETVAGLSEVWSASVGDLPVGDPVTSARGVHVGDGRSVQAFAARTGTPLWSHEVDAPLALGQPFARGEQVLVGRADPTHPEGSPAPISTVALDAATGVVLGEQPGAIRAVRGDRALLVDGDWYRFGLLQPIWVWLHDLVVVDLGTGAEVYRARFDTGGPGETLGMDATLAADAVHVWKVATVDPSLGGPPPGQRAYSFTTSPPSCNFTLGRCPNWAVTDGLSAPVLSDDETVAYALGQPGELRAVDAATGAIMWRASLAAAPTAVPALAGGRLYVPTSTGELVVLDAAGCGAATCAPLWTAPTGSPIGTQPAVAGGVVFTASVDGSVDAFAAAGCGEATCAPLWSATVGAEVTGAPAVSNGRLYVGTADGRLVAYGLATAPT